MLREKVLGYALKKYGTKPEYLWARFPLYAVLRHESNQKWYALIMNLAPEKLNLKGSDEIDVLNLKMPDAIQKQIIINEEKGVLEGYHISRGDWISVLLDGSVKFSKICELLDMSYQITLKNRKKTRPREAKEWLVPANPKFYDIVHAFDNQNEIIWKQSADIRVGDTVFLYVGAPICAVLYKCEVMAINLPYEYHSKELNITKVMKIKLVKRYEKEQFGFGILKSKFKITAIRGARGITNSLSVALNR